MTASGFFHGVNEQNHGSFGEHHEGRWRDSELKACYVLRSDGRKRPRAFARARAFAEGYRVTEHLEVNQTARCFSGFAVDRNGFNRMVTTVRGGY